MLDSVIFFILIKDFTEVRRKIVNNNKLQKNIYLILFVKIQKGLGRVDLCINLKLPTILGSDILIDEIEHEIVFLQVYKMNYVTYTAGDFWVSRSGPFEILENLPHGYRKIRFLRTGNEYVVTKGEIRKRVVLDTKSDEKPKWDNLLIRVRDRKEADEYIASLDREL